jgi:hypothetical protein
MVNLPLLVNFVCALELMFNLVLGLIYKTVNNGTCSQFSVKINRVLDGHSNVQGGNEI